MQQKIDQSSSTGSNPLNLFFSGQSNLNTPSLEAKKIQPAIEYFRQLQIAQPSTQLEDFLSNFSKLVCSIMPMIKVGDGLF